MKKLIVLFAILSVLSSCKQDKVVTESSSPIDVARKKLEAERTNLNAEELLEQINLKLAEKTASADEEKALLEEGLGIAKEFRLGNQTVNFLAPLVKYYPNHPKLEEYYAALTNTITGTYPLAGDVLIEGYKKQYPNGTYTEELVGKQTAPVEDAYKLLFETGKKIFADDKAIDKLQVRKYVNLSEAFAFAFPDDERTPEVLFKAAELSGSLGTYGKTMSLFDWLSRRYPDSNQTANSIFLKGFILDNDFNDMEGAKEAYAEFLRKFPDHELATNVQFLYDNLGKSDEELIKELESHQEKK